ncbi:glutaredoxin 3 [Candidatus Thiodiazotropha sp. CDECU1]|uniref:glutaredoxin 3 n=1 Tax=Candidatus Thiodiazotropha sp. CDECU1 TaxID=3065865 RepID=UPI00292FDE22|nr:glutaredoxin 3 [Candidatus Thiodiazotropha sp. CDECU1]
MSDVAIYTQPSCPYCSHAKALLESRQIAYEELDVSGDPQVLTEMIERTGGRTFPQIMVGNQAIGGFDDLRSLDSNGELLPLLQTQRGKTDTGGI